MTLSLLVLVPAAEAAASALAQSRRAMETMHVLSAVTLFATAVRLAYEVSSFHAVTGGRGLLYADHLSALVALLAAFVYLACAPYAVGYFRDGHDAPAVNVRHYYALTPLFVACMMVVATAANLGVMWAALEGTTLTSIFLVTFYGRPTSIEAAWKYAMIGGAGLSMALFGTILTFYAANQALGAESFSALNWTELAAGASRFNPTVMRLAFVLVLLGFGTKAGLAPMHTWKPDAYSEAPVPVAALMAAGVLNCAIYALARFYVLAVRSIGPTQPSQLLVLFGLASVAVAVPFILVQRSYRRLLAYSSIDHSGIMVLGLGFGGWFGPLGMLLHMTYHSIAKPLLFFCAGNAQQQTGNDHLPKSAGGLIHVLPVSAPVFLMAALAVTGAPPFSLFQSEFLILRAGVAAGKLILAVLFVTLLVAVFAGFFTHISRLVLGPAPHDAPRGETCRWKTWPVIALAVLVVVTGFWLPAPLYNLVEGAARILMVRP